MLATISVDAMQKFYGRFGVGAHGAIALFSPDGVVIARQPADDSLIGVDVSRGQLFRAVVKRSSDDGSLQYVSSLDDTIRLGSYQLVEDFPLVVVVSHGLEDALADWRADTWYHSTITLGVAAVFALFGYRFARQAKLGKRVERRYRLLAEHSSDAVVCVAMDGEQLYVSPTFGQMTGWSDQESAGREWTHFVHPDDRRAVRDIVQRLSNGIGQATATYRHFCKDGSPLWVEASFVLLPAEDGEPAQFVANIRDITARKFAEDRLTAANQELAKQVAYDSLTRLANRRRFAEALDQEWKRAARDVRPLSLLMIDVDCFKAYNDRYGHQRGDQALQSVATAIASLVRRPGDLVARYEEKKFAVVLTNTEAFEASEVAEKVRAAIEELGIEHPTNLPAGCVTASIGIGTSYPARQDAGASQETLISTTDTALFGAKRSGRNRARIAMPSESVSQGKSNTPDKHLPFSAQKTS